MENLTGTYEKRKLFGMELINWLETNGGEAWSGAWRRYVGRDHFLIIGRTTWDFRPTQYWGTGFMELPHVKNIRASPPVLQKVPVTSKSCTVWRSRLIFEIAIVAPEKVRDLSCSNPNDSADLQICEKYLPPNPIAIVRGPLQPRGDSATRRSTFDCLISGSIPVFFHVDSAYTQYLWHLPEDPKSYSVLIDEKDLKEGVSMQEVLMSYSQDQIEDMRRNIVAIIPKLLYNDFENDPWSTPRHGKDAYEISIEGALEKIAAAKVNQQQLR